MHLYSRAMINPDNQCQAFTYFHEVEARLRIAGLTKKLMQKNGEYTALTTDDCMATFADDGFLLDYACPRSMTLEETLESQKKFSIALDEIFINLGLQKQSIYDN